MYAKSDLLLNNDDLFVFQFNASSAHLQSSSFFSFDLEIGRWLLSREKRSKKHTLGEDEIQAICRDVVLA